MEACHVIHKSMQGNPPSVWVVVLNYNGASDTLDCLQSLAAVTYENYKIVVVDNASTDASMERISDYLLHCVSEGMVCFDSPKHAMSISLLPKKYTLIRNNINGGYGCGNNVGVRYALKNEADFVLILNNDTTVAPGFIEPMLDLFQDTEETGIVSGKVFYWDHPDTIWFNGGEFAPCSAMLKHCNFNEKDTGQLPPEKITFLSGCAWLVPRELFETVGYINETFFMYVEDLEFCQRVMAHGYQLKVAHQSHIWHKVGGSSDGRFSSFNVYYRVRNYIDFVRSSPWNLWCKFTSISILILRTFYRIVRAGKYASLKAVFNGVIAGWKL